MRNVVSASAKKFRIALLAVLCVMMALGGIPWRWAEAQSQQLYILRDAEIEDTIRVYATPLFEAAGVPPSAVKLHLVGSDEINAFVTQGNNMFIYSGLLTETDDPNQVIGVIAHETGHIAGGHVLRSKGAADNASATAILGLLLGVAVAVASGNGQAAAAGASVGQGLAISDFLSFSRSVESSADQAALTYLDETHQSAEGLYNMFKKFENQDLLTPGSQDPYMRTHPLTGDRLMAVQAHLETSPYSDAKEPAELQERQDRMVAKLVGYLKPLRVVLQRYPESDQSIAARYARAHGYYRDKQMDKALPLVDGLIAEEPDNPYFQELKGLMLFDNGDYAGSMASYKRAVELAPDQPLIRIQYAHVLIENGGTADLETATGELEAALRIEPENASAWQRLGIAYGKLGQEARGHVASAEAAYLSGDTERARYLADRAVQGLPYGSPEWQRANDILSALGGGSGG
jgi:predicted Zn-dependent protease